MANKIWKEVFLIMCSSSRKNARNTERFSLSLRITDDYALHTLCGEQHKVCNEEGLINGLPFNRRVPGGYGGVFGTFFICGLGEEDFCSLPAELVERFKSEYQNSELLIGAKGNEPITLPIPSKPKLTGRPSNGKERQNPER